MKVLSDSKIDALKKLPKKYRFQKLLLIKDLIN